MTSRFEKIKAFTQTQPASGSPEEKKLNQDLREKSLSCSTFEQYARIVKLYEATVKSADPYPLNCEKLQTFIRALLSDTSPEGLTAATIRKYVSAVKTICEIRFGSVLSDEDSAA
jgi:site-specific recombinase XerC